MPRAYPNTPATSGLSTDNSAANTLRLSLFVFEVRAKVYTATRPGSLCRRAATPAAQQRRCPNIAFASCSRADRVPSRGMLLPTHRDAAVRRSGCDVDTANATAATSAVDVDGDVDSNGFGCCRLGLAADKHFAFIISLSMAPRATGRSFALSRVLCTCRIHSKLFTLSPSVCVCWCECVHACECVSVCELLWLTLSAASVVRAACCISPATLD